MSNVKFGEATDSAATAGNPAPANATTQANRAQSASPAGASPAGAPLLNPLPRGWWVHDYWRNGGVL